MERKAYDPKKWTSVAVTKDTHKQLTDEKIMKSPGTPENYNDVIRRKIGWPAETEKEDKPC